MKKLTRKLFLSVCTLAICAVTLVSTTFAWYTTNSEVSASAVTGTSSDASTDDSILIATSIDKTVNNWSEFSNSVTITENSYLKVGTDLEPLTFNSKGALDNQANALSNTESAAHTNASGAYILIPLKFKTGANDSNAVNIYLKSLSITNTAEEALAKFDGIVEAGGVEKGVQYSIDVCYAINMIVAEDQNPSPDNKVYDLGTQVTENATADPTIDGSSTKYGTGAII